MDLLAEACQIDYQGAVDAGIERFSVDGVEIPTLSKEALIRGRLGVSWTDLAMTMANFGFALVAWGASASAAQEPPRVSIEVVGSCPERPDVVRRLEASVRVVEDASDAWRVRIRSSRRATTMTLIDPQGQSDLERRFASADCAAMADGIALIVQTRFVELALLPPEAIQVLADTTPGNPENPPVSPEANEDVPVRVPPASIPDAPNPPTSVDDNAADAYFTLNALLGPQASVDPGELVGQVQIGLGLASRALPWSGRLSLFALLPSSHTSGAEEVNVIPFGARLEGHLRIINGDFELSMGAAGGVAFHHVTALSLDDQPSVLQVAPVMSIIPRIGLRISPAWRVVVQLDGTLLPLADDYVVRPTGIVGQSARFWAAFLAGLEWAPGL